jgi:DNA-binding transcriptional regulator GbsR (MarR family)
MDLQDTITKISQLQKTEEKLYALLTHNAERVALGKQDTFTEKDIQYITDQINSLSSARVNLYNTLSDLYKSQINSESTMKESVDQQTETLKLLEEELNKSKKKMSALKDEKLNHLKMIEITTYYSKQYDAQKRLMQIIAGVGICLFISMYFQIKPLTTFIIIVGIIWIGYRLINMAMRDNENYDEFNFFYPPNKDGANSHPIGFSGPGIGKVCIGSVCCNEGTVWDSQLGCVIEK